MTLGLDLDCPHCKGRFYLCYSCWRGHVYCSEACRVAGRKTSLVAIRLRYAVSPKGKANHIKRNFTFRVGRRKHSETDHPSGAPAAPVAAPSSVPVEAIPPASWVAELAAELRRC